MSEANEDEDLSFPELDQGLSPDEIAQRLATFGHNEVVPKKERFIITLLKKFIGPVEVILEVLAVYFFCVAPFIPQATSPPTSSSTNLTQTNVTASPSPSIEGYAESRCDRHFCHLILESF